MICDHLIEWMGMGFDDVGVTLVDQRMEFLWFLVGHDCGFAVLVVAMNAVGMTVTVISVDDLTH